MCFYNIVGDAQTQSRALRALLGREKRLQNLVLDVVGDARTVVLDVDDDAVTNAVCADLQVGVSTASHLR